MKSCLVAIENGFSRLGHVFHCHRPCSGVEPDVAIAVLSCEGRIQLGLALGLEVRRALIAVSVLVITI